MAMRIFALGDVLGFWKLRTPRSLNITGDDAEKLAGTGFVLVSDVNWEEKQNG